MSRVRDNSSKISYWKKSQLKAPQEWKNLGQTSTEWMKFQGKSLCLCQSVMPNQALSLKHHMYANDSKTPISHPDLVWNPFMNGCLYPAPYYPRHFHHLLTYLVTYVKNFSHPLFSFSPLHPVGWLVQWIVPPKLILVLSTPFHLNCRYLIQWYHPLK